MAFEKLFVIEHPQAVEARVIPILLRPVDWAGAPFIQLEVLPRNHQPVTSWSIKTKPFAILPRVFDRWRWRLERKKGTRGAEGQGR
jgi:hypothetical protein